MCSGFRQFGLLFGIRVCWQHSLVSACVYVCVYVCAVSFYAGILHSIYVYITQRYMQHFHGPQAYINACTRMQATHLEIRNTAQHTHTHTHTHVYASHICEVCANAHARMCTRDSYRGLQHLCNKRKVKIMHMHVCVHVTHLGVCNISATSERSKSWKRFGYSAGSARESAALAFTLRKSSRHAATICIV
jgi:hypothetical protein